MPNARTPVTPGSWSRSLRDSDDDDDSPDHHLAPTSSASPARTKRTSTPIDEGSDWAWGADTVDIGLVSEPQGLKFVETPFTLAKRTGASKHSATSNRPTAPKGTSSQYKTPRSTPVKPPAPPKPPSSFSLPPLKVDKPTPTGPATARGAKTAASSPTSSRGNRPPALSRAPPHLPVAHTSSSSPLAPRRPTHEVVLQDVPETAPTTTATSDSHMLPSFSSSVPAPSTPSTTPLLAKAAPAPGPTSSSPLAIRADSPSPRSPSPSSSPPAFQAPLLRPTAVRPVPSGRSLAPGAPSIARAAAAAAAPPPTPSTSTRPYALDEPLTRISTPPPRKKQRVPLPALGPPALAGVALDLPGPAHASPPSGAPPRRSGAGAAAGTASSGAAQARLERFRHVGNFAAAPSAGAGAGAGTGVGASTGAGAGAREVSTGGAGGREGGAGASAAEREEPRTTSRPSDAASRPTTALHTSTFRLPGLVPSSSSPSSRQHAPSSPTDRLAFKPAESLAEFRARRAAEVEAAARGRGTGAGGRGEEAGGGGGGGGGGPPRRERIVLGTAVRSVRPVALAQAPLGSGSSMRGRGRGRARGGFAAPRAGGAGAGAGHGRGDEPGLAASRGEGESAEARLRRVYRSLDG
ncbi:hypothetical protein JCM8208_007273 [Rhodotorula glutinis]